MLFGLQVTMRVDSRLGVNVIDNLETVLSPEQLLNSAKLKVKLARGDIC